MNVHGFLFGCFCARLSNLLNQKLVTGSSVQSQVLNKRDKLTAKDNTSALRETVTLKLIENLTGVFESPSRHHLLTPRWRKFSRRSICTQYNAKISLISHARQSVKLYKIHSWLVTVCFNQCKVSHTLHVVWQAENLQFSSSCSWLMRKCLMVHAKSIKHLHTGKFLAERPRLLWDEHPFSMTVQWNLVCTVLPNLFESVFS